MEPTAGAHEPGSNHDPARRLAAAARGRAAALDARRTVLPRRVGEPRLVRSFAAAVDGVSLAFTADGRGLVFDQGGRYVVGDLATGRLSPPITVAGDDDPNTGVSADGRAIHDPAELDRRTRRWNILVWDVATRRRVGQFPVPEIEVYPDLSMTPVASHHGQYLYAVSDGLDVAIWDAAAGRILRRLAGARGGVDWPVSSRDGSTVVAVAVGGLIAWDVATGRRLRTLRVDTGGLGFAVAPRGTHVATLRGDTLWVWRLRDGRADRRIPLGHQARSLGAFSGDGALLALGLEDVGTRFLDVRSGTLSVYLPPLNEHPESFVFAPTGRRVAAYHGGAASVWDLDDTTSARGRGSL